MAATAHVSKYDESLIVTTEQGEMVRLSFVAYFNDDATGIMQGEQCEAYHALDATPGETRIAVTQSVLDKAAEISGGQIVLADNRVIIPQLQRGNI